MDKKTVAIIGATGLVGSALAEAYERENWQVVRISRSEKQVPGQVWKVYSAEAIEGADVVLNFSGASIDKRWTESYKKKMRSSRIGVAEDIAGWIKSSENPPSVWVNASAVGIYGDRGEELLDENSAPAEGFLPQLCKDWEAAATVEDSSCRVVNTRLAVVVGEGAEAWEKMVMPFKLFVGGKLSSGEQYFAWIHLDDVVGAVMHCVDSAEISGPVNLAAPEQITNAEFTDQLASHLNKPAIFTVPKFALQILLGDFANTLLASLRVVPAELQASGYQFQYPRMEKVLKTDL